MLLQLIVVSTERLFTVVVLLVHLRARLLREERVSRVQRRPAVVLQRVCGHRQLPAGDDVCVLWLRVMHLHSGLRRFR